MVPSMGQGALGIEAVNDAEVLKIVAGLEDEYSRVETTIERSFVDALDGGCQVPIGVNASVLEDGNVSIRAVLGLPDGSEMLSDIKVVSRKNYETVGREIAAEFIARGAKELLLRAEAMMENK
jgi:hydroxymethylbilane synthase